MSDFLCMKTLESDDDIDYDDDSEIEEVEEEKPKKGKKQKQKKTKVKNDFNVDFAFSSGEPPTNPLGSWQITKSVKETAKGKASIAITEEKIRQKLDEKNAEDEGFEEEDEYEGEGEAEEEEEGEKDGFFAEAPAQTDPAKTFAQMNLSRPLLKAVNDLGYVSPTPIQSRAIPVGLLGKDICACATTGSGKTAAFMLPILERLLFKPKVAASVTRVLVLVPTRELAIQVHSVSENLAKHSSVTMCLAAGGLDSKAQEVALRACPDVIVATPGRLIDHLHNTPTFDLQTVEVLVLDEADRMLEEHFRDQLNEIIRLCPRGRQTMLFSATMTDEVEQLVSLSLNQPVKLFVDQNTDVALNLHQEFVRIRETREADRLAVVTALCVRTFHERTLVFVQTKILAHKLRIVLGLQGVNCTELHGDLSMLQRLEALEKFKEGSVDLLVATDLAARGLDISGVRTVISFNLPSTVRSYIHRVGRTARAGKAGRSITLVGEKERKFLKEVVRSARVPVKNRVVPPEVIARFRKKMDELDADIKDILKQELEEKELRIAEMQMRKAENLVTHHSEIMSRPARTFINTKNEKKANADAKKKKEAKAKAAPTDEERKLQHEQNFITRTAKRAKQPKRIRAYQEDLPGGGGGGPAKKRKPNDNQPAGGGVKKPVRAFDRELTDTSKKAVKGLRYVDYDERKKTKKPGGFKSKKKYKRK